MEIKKTLGNRVVVKLDPENNFVRTKSGFELYVDTSFEPEKHMTLTGTVISAPDKISYSKEGGDVPWETDVELKEGDKVVMYYLAVMNCLAKERRQSITENGEVYIFIKYHNIYAKVSDGNITPINGFILVEPVDMERDVDKKVKSLGLESVNLKEKTKKEVVYGVVCYTGNKIKRYFDNTKSDEGVEVEKGNFVVMKRVRDIPIEYEYHAKIDGGRKLFRVQRHDILATI